MIELFAPKNQPSIAYAQYGDPHGYPLLIQHGLIASIEDGGLFDSLAGMGLRLICPARPGYGDSPPCRLGSYAEWAELLAPLLAALGLERFDLLGMSSGAPYAYAIAARYPRQARQVYIFSGLPALCDPAVRAAWPYPAPAERSLPALQALAWQLFFAGLSPAELERADLRDSARYEAFGVAQDLGLRFADWGFPLKAVKQRVFMRLS